ncbi:MAG TPA: prepilin peptidase [Kofleriaceae bacterium]|nr:prepilin peptidase [Kofleriaceae bacterium]
MLDSLDPLATSTGAYVVVVVLGLLFGSFANVCIYRWPPSDEFPRGRSVMWPGSHCFACKAPIRWYDNVPVLAWLWLRGRCRSCRAPFSPRYLVVELICGALFGFTWWAAVVAPLLFEPFSDRLIHFVVDAAFGFVMVVITFIDLDHKLILNKVTIPSMVVFYAASFLWPDRHWYDGVVGAAVGYGLPWVIGEIYYRITHREGLGLGDGMLLALVGALLGWRGVLVSLFGGAMIGSVIGITALLVGRDEGPAGDEGDGTPATGEGGGPEGPEGLEGPERPEGRDGGEASGRPDGREGAEPSEADERSAPGAPPSILRTELPFGPFLAMAALFYLFAERWIQLHFHLPGG